MEQQCCVFIGIVFVTAAAGFCVLLAALVAVVNDLFNGIFNALRASGSKGGYAPNSAASTAAAPADTIIAIALVVKALVHPNGGGRGGFVGWYICLLFGGQ